MASTFTIPLTTLAVGAHDFGPAPVPDGDTTITLVIDRTVAGGFNSQPGTTQAAVAVSQSGDGGVTWQGLAGMGPIIGGSFTSAKTGLPVTSERLFTQFSPGTGRVARATVTVAGAGVAVAGTLTTA